MKSYGTTDSEGYIWFIATSIVRYIYLSESKKVMLPLSLLILFAHPVVDTVVITNNIVVFAVVTPSRNIANVLLTTAITASLVYIIVQDHYSLCCSPSNHFPYNFHVSYIYYIYYGVCNHCNY